MVGPRLSIASMMLVVLAVGLGLAALRNPSPLRASAAFTVTMGLVLAAILGSRVAREPLRSDCLGFSWFAGVYFVIALVYPFEIFVRPNLLTSKLLNDLYPPVTGRAIERTFVRGPIEPFFYAPDLLIPAPELPFAWKGTYICYVRTGHCLFALLSGIVGVVLARFLNARDHADHEMS
jgi:hypothetical protein